MPKTWRWMLFWTQCSVEWWSCDVNRTWTKCCRWSDRTGKPSWRTSLTSTNILKSIAEASVEVFCIWLSLCISSSLLLYPLHVFADFTMVLSCLCIIVQSCGYLDGIVFHMCDYFLFALNVWLIVIFWYRVISRNLTGDLQLD